MGEVGRPPTYETVEEMQKKIDQYFNSCKGEMLKDEDGQPILDKYNKPIFINQKPYTVTGLALYLGFTSRRALLNYEAKEEFVHAITRAKTKIEEYAETRLYDKDGCNGAKFNLQNNFGWREKTEIESSNTNLNLNKDVSSMTEAEIDAELKKYE